MKKPDLKKFHSWVYDAKWTARDWRDDAWRCNEAIDGKILTDAEYNDLIDAGITPLDINRIFPVVNLIRGSHAINKYDTVAKGRTNEDSEISQTMSEGIKFVMDQNNGEFLESEVFNDATGAGAGYLFTGFNPDPRKERVMIRYQDWKSFWFDPFSEDPWLDVNRCRYVFNHPWKDYDELVSLFPDKEKEIKEQYNQLTSESDEPYGYFEDEADIVEQEKLGATEWVDTVRKRVRPIELWYTEYEDCMFAVFADGRTVELTEDGDTMAQFQVIQSAQEVVQARVKKVRVCTFIGDLVLQHMKTPMPHDGFPYTPFIGYTDRFGFPYGVPRQILGQNIEVIKRRSMALELLKSRRTIVEEDAPAEDGPDALYDLHDEVNKIDGLIVLRNGALAKGKIKIDEMGQLAQGQMAMHDYSEREIQQISGANDEMMGYHGRVQSGKAIELKQNQGVTVTASIFDNLRRSKKDLGEKVVSLIQGTWRHEKVLRITDRLTGAERFVELNKPIPVQGGAIEVKNNITQGRYDVVVSETPQTDTVREQNLNLIIEWVKKSPPEIIPHLLSLAFELTNLPNKETLLARIKPALGISPGEEDLSPEEIKEQNMQQAEAQKKAAQVQSQVNDQLMQLKVEEQQLKNEEIKARIEQIRSGIQTKSVETDLKKGESEVNTFEKGYHLGKDMNESQSQV
ncbi:MAG: hypothetical protein GY696_13210 [Gammaproteobacteria bacterium]|nr:hypothetical protein [Gammaproteobacteria bacterium]